MVVDEAVTTGRGFFAQTRAAAPHDWLSNMGGSIGMGMPVATGAAVGCPRSQSDLPRRRRRWHVHSAGIVDPGPYLVEVVV
jgi:hypothetical protein